MRACQNMNPVIDGRRANCNLACLGAQKPRPPTSPRHGLNLSLSLSSLNSNGNQLQGDWKNLIFLLDQHVKKSRVLFYDSWWKLDFQEQVDSDHQDQELDQLLLLLSFEALLLPLLLFINNNNNTLLNSHFLTLLTGKNT